MRTPEALQAVLAEAQAARGADRRLDGHLARLGRELAGAREPGAEAGARRLAEALALALQGSLLVRFAPHAVADAFCAGRLAPDGGRAFGTLPAGTDLAAILDRHAPTA
jgi:putative acyl-CoA dehydrogenase